MRNYRPLRHAFAAAVLLALLLAAALLPGRAGALVRMSPAVALWRILVHEASLPIWSESPSAVRRFPEAAGSLMWISGRTGRPWGQTDVLGIHEVLLRGVERTGIPYVAFAQTYAHRMWDPLSDIERQRLALGLPLEGNRWAGFLTDDFRRPEGWSRADGAWNPEAARFAFELASDIVQYDLRALEEFSPCESAVDDWGSPRLDHERAVRIGLVPVDCGPDAINAFYARPSQIRIRATSGASIDSE